jgi:ERCC4-type nuclease
MPKNLRILVDTREQDPLPFENTGVEKLFIGDYLLDAEYSYTYVDRKSSNDFIGTMTSGLSRFEREIETTVSLNGYLFVVVESSITNIYANYGNFTKATTIEYAFHNMRALCHKYPRRIQFLFTGNRAKSIEIIPKLLRFGKELWETDIQYFLDSKPKTNLK